MNKDALTGEEWNVAGKDGVCDEADLENCVPLSVREARRARKMRDDLWPYVWMNFASMVLLFAAAVIMAYRMGGQSCR